jgi:hypothetical protein
VPCKPVTKTRMGFRKSPCFIGGNCYILATLPVVGAVCDSIETMRNNTLDGSDLGFLVNAVLIQVAVGENETILRTHPETSVTITASVEVNLLDGSAQIWEAAVDVGRSLLHLLGKAVVQAVGTSDGAMVLTWSDGTTIKVLNSWEHYESYTVAHGGSVFVV